MAQMIANGSLRPDETQPTGGSVGKRAGKYLTFSLGGEEYALEILRVQEIIGMMPVTSVPRTPPHILGVVNLRGKVIPVIDMRLKFAMERLPQTEQTCIVVIQARGTQFGMVVDRVSEVVDIPEEQIEDTPTFGEEVNTDYILGVGKSGNKVMLLLNIDKVLSTEDVIPASGKVSDNPVGSEE